MPSKIHKVEENFKILNLPEKEIEKAITNLKYWLMHPSFSMYQEQIDHMIEKEHFEEIFDCFYQTMPFGTAGRRGKIGVGPNRINRWAIASTAQGHSQFLAQKYGSTAKKRGVVIAYDVRQYIPTSDDHFIPKNMHGISSKDFAEITSGVYAKNGFKVYIFRDIAPTPLLSFSVRRLNAIAGIVISASHNTPEYNGIKVFDEYGGQMLAPEDQKLADEINENVDIHDVEWGIFQDDIQQGKISYIEENIIDDYIQELIKISTSTSRNVRILYSPLHGTGKINVYKSMKRLGFDIHIDNDSSIPSGDFETVVNKSPNPELPEIYERLYLQASDIDADIVLASDPDADRIGISVRHNDKWRFIDGNQIVSLLVYYLGKKEGNKGKIVLATKPVTKLIRKIASKFELSLEDSLIPGFKYIGHRMNTFEKKGNMKKFLIACEDTHGHLSRNFARDKEASVGAILLSEFASELKEYKKTLIDVLDEIYQEFNFFQNTTRSIGLKHTFEKYKIDEFMQNIRSTEGKNLERLNVKDCIDELSLSPILCETDRQSRNLIELYLNPPEPLVSERVLIRPSGTEPKLKIYIEVETKYQDKALADSETERIFNYIKSQVPT